jgi:hypothetical protein
MVAVLLTFWVLTGGIIAGEHAPLHSSGSHPRNYGIYGTKAACNLDRKLFLRKFYKGYASCNEIKDDKELGDMQRIDPWPEGYTDANHKRNAD